MYFKTYIILRVCVLKIYMCVCILFPLIYDRDRKGKYSNTDANIWGLD